jgi:hypothetical protein
MKRGLCDIHAICVCVVVAAAAAAAVVVVVAEAVGVVGIIQFNSLLFMCRANSHKANYRHSTV